MCASSTKEIVSIAGSSRTFSRVVSIGACSVTSKAWSWSFNYRLFFVGYFCNWLGCDHCFCWNFDLCFDYGAASTVSAGASSTAIVGCSIGAASSTTAT